ncbi:dihydrodipicolinate synthase family protein [Luteitalea sp.]|uniref:dihydrodipicolinate synthase family protein n=1 Tax=Luteitalea sp. TaxID=2004800 RepID=UPI000AC03629|nr:dihydrodipicolinate synthase family protein [Luteitalea sp.]
MITTPLTPAHFTRSVMAVPPLARAADRSLAEEANGRIVRHLERGGVSLLLYGGNANFYHLPLPEYDAALSMLARLAGPETLVVPSAGPTYALLLEQARAIRRQAFPTVMVLPQQGITTSEGVANGIREFVAAAGVPVIVYVKNDGYIEPADIAALDKEGLVSAVKYAVVRKDTSDDPYLRTLTSLVDPRKVISGIGEQPAIVHVRDFGLGGFTSGCVCVAPKLSQAMLAAVTRQDWVEAERIRAIFRPLEDLRNAINPIRVLHQAVESAGIAETGPLLPLLTTVGAEHVPAIAAAAQALLAADAG